MSLLALSDITAQLGGNEVLRGVSLEVGAGEFVGLIGPNGAGKSTLMRAAIGLIPAGGGRRIGDDPMEQLAAGERARRVAYLPQGREVAWPVTVETLVALGRAPYRKSFAPPDAADRAAVEAALARMDVADFRRRPATDLSGGEQARVLIARALAQEAPLLIADEPTAGLDPSHQIELMETFAALAREGRGVLASLHDLGLAARWCGRVALMNGGYIVAEGAPADVLTAERLQQVYGITARIEDGPDGLLVQPLARVH